MSRAAHDERPEPVAAQDSPRTAARKREDFLQWALRRHKNRLDACRAGRMPDDDATVQAEAETRDVVEQPPEYVICEQIVGIAHPDRPARQVPTRAEFEQQQLASSFDAKDMQDILRIQSTARRKKAQQEVALLKEKKTAAQQHAAAAELERAQQEEAAVKIQTKVRQLEAQKRVSNMRAGKSETSATAAA